MSEFCPEVWPEDPTPKSELNCKECGLYDHGTRMIWGEGNTDAPITIILDNPGARENSMGESIVCGTRETLQHAIDHVGLGKSLFYVTYILKRRPIKKYNKEQTRKICMTHHLNEQLKHQNPQYILCLGNVAVQSFFADHDVDVKGLRGSWYNVNGYETTVAYHPLAIRRRPNLHHKFIEDLTLVKTRFLNEN